MNMTIQEAAQQAIDVQDACNLSGVAGAFSRAMHAVFVEAERLGKGTDWRNAHPIATLFLSKMCSLNGGYFDCGNGNYFRAAQACEAVARGEELREDWTTALLV